MLPAIHGKLKIGSISIDTKEQSFTERKVHGKNYAFVVIYPGREYEISADYR
jgi:hypothetical protein